jgi:regulatory protein
MTEEAALQTALRYLAPRPRSEHEVRQRLQRSKHSDEVIEAVLERLRAHALVDDAAFTRYWVEQRQTFRPRGARLLRAELRQHGIRADPAPGLDPEADAYRAAVRRARQSAQLDRTTFGKRIGQFLARRGFDWDVIAPTVQRLWLEVSTS